MTKKFEPAPVDVEIVDVWPPGTFTKPIMMAYAKLANDKRVRLHLPVEISPNTGRAIMRYHADVPAEWIHKELGEIKDAIIRDGEQIRLEV